MDLFWAPVLWNLTPGVGKTPRFWRQHFGIENARPPLWRIEGTGRKTIPADANFSDCPASAFEFSSFCPRSLSRASVLVAVSFQQPLSSRLPPSFGPTPALSLKPRLEQRFSLWLSPLRLGSLQCCRLSGSPSSQRNRRSLPCPETAFQSDPR